MKLEFRLKVSQKHFKSSVTVYEKTSHFFVITVNHQTRFGFNITAS